MTFKLPTLSSSSSDEDVAASSVIANFADGAPREPARFLGGGGQEADSFMLSAAGAYALPVDAPLVVPTPPFRKPPHQ